MAISIERYLVICRPFYRISCSYSSKTAVAIIVCFSVVYNIPKFFEIEPLSITPSSVDTHYNLSIYNSTNDQMEKHLLQANNNSSISLKLGYRIAPTSLIRNPYYYQIYLVGFNIAFNGIVPFLVLTSLNALILEKLVQQNALERHETFQSIPSQKVSVASIISGE